MKVVRTAFAVLAVAIAAACTSTPTAPVDQADLGVAGTDQNVSSTTYRGVAGTDQ